MEARLSLRPLASSDTVSFMYIALAIRLPGLLFSVAFISHSFPQAQRYFQTSEALERWMQRKSEDGDGCTPATPGTAAVRCHLAPFGPPPRLILTHFQRLWFLQWWTECSQERSRQFQCQDRSGFISTSLELEQKVKEQYIPVSIRVLC